VLTRGGTASSVDGMTVAVPSERSTAYLLFRLWAAGQRPAAIEVVPFADIMPAVRDGKYDAGLVIHEARFVYPDYGLTSLVDLGEWWEADTGLPIPLGAILAKRGLDADVLTNVIRSSVEYAWAHPEASAEFIAEHAAEMSPEVQRRHIDLYVNEFTRDLGEEGYEAIETLLGRAHREGLIPARPIVR
jgi:1,4-dihydroxy-6-naphthoate synthase